MAPNLSSRAPQRRRWPIDDQLAALAGREVRLEASRFSPNRWEGAALPKLIPVRDLILPDNTIPSGLTVFFEGRLARWLRRIGVVHVWLEAPAEGHRSEDGIFLFRGRSVVVLSGPATLELAAPFHVEALPATARNYWQDLRVQRAQFDLPFSPE